MNSFSKANKKETHSKQSVPLFEGGFHFYSQLFLSFFPQKLPHCLTWPGKESIKNPSCDEKSVEVRTEVISGLTEDSQVHHMSTQWAEAVIRLEISGRDWWLTAAGGQLPSYLPPLPILIRANNSQTRRSADCGPQWEQSVEVFLFTQRLREAQWQNNSEQARDVDISSPVTSGGDFLPLIWPPSSPHLSSPSSYHRPSSWPHSAASSGGYQPSALGLLLLLFLRVCWQFFSWSQVIPE